jgi:hypothetical protein
MPGHGSLGVEDTAVRFPVRVVRWQILMRHPDLDQNILSSAVLGKVTGIAPSFLNSL